MHKEHIGGLEGLWLQNGYEGSGDEVRIRDPEGLMSAIALELCRARHRLAPDGIRFLRRLIERSQAELDALLGLPEGTVAACETGAARLPEPASVRLRNEALAGIGAQDPAVEAQTLIPACKLVFAHGHEGWTCVERAVVPALLQGAPPAS
ncbi:MAG: hypothetical protein LPJ94_10055 [Thauera sp.]|nr:hypothetical protein [Thauera sp.]